MSDFDKQKMDDKQGMDNGEYIPLSSGVNAVTSHDIIASLNRHDEQDGEDLFNRAGDGDMGSTVPGNNTNGDFPRSIEPFDMRSEFGGPSSESIPDVNIYQNKKTVAQGMMDLALFSANANQLRYVLESQDHPYYYPGIVLISISLIFQVAVGVGLLLNTRYNVKDKKEICIANKINNFTVVGIFMVTVINVFISAFGVASGAVPLAPRSGEIDGDGAN